MKVVVHFYRRNLNSRTTNLQNTVCIQCGNLFVVGNVERNIHPWKKHLKEEHSHSPIDEKQKLIDELMKMNENLENQNIAFEMEVKASHTIIARMKGENEHFKKGKTVADKVIQNLKEKLNLQSKDIFDAKKISEENKQLILDKETLEREVVEIQEENILKEENLKTIMNEMKFLEKKNTQRIKKRRLKKRIHRLMPSIFIIKNQKKFLP